VEVAAAAGPVPIPVPVAVGAPGQGYPLPWTVQTWLPGQVATVEDSSGSVPFAGDLAAFISSLRAADTRGRRFSGPGRGGHLPDHDDWMELCFEKSSGLLDVERLRRLWADLRGLPRAGADVMSHGDLEWVRGMAWAFEQAMGLVWYYAESNRPMSRLGVRTLDRLLAEI
jgi:aminoglycoside phosphotransferase (APT) family kinase protein